MKKFYEKPVVEITKFAFEDIMAATPSYTMTIDTTQGNPDAIINQIEASNSKVQAKKFRAYNW